MSDVSSMTEEEKKAYMERKKARTFKKFQWQGMDLEALLKVKKGELAKYVRSRMKRRFRVKGVGRKPMRLMKRLRQAKRAAGPMDKPEPIKTHLRDMPIFPEMVGSQVGVYNGKHFYLVEVKPQMIGHYLGEFSITYNPVSHGRPGIGSTNSSRFIPLK
eukprot:g1302.t1